jgi:hypothetical protein
MSTIEVRHVIQQFDGGRRRPRDHSVIVVRVHHRRSRFREHASARFLACRRRRVTKNDLRAVTSHSPLLHLGRVARHDDVRRDPAQRGGAGECRTVIARRMGCDARTRLLLGEREDRIAGPARLEGAHVLEVLAFEVQLRSRLVIEEAAGHHGRAVNVRLDAFVCGANVFDRRRLHRSALRPRLA